MKKIVLFAGLAIFSASPAFAMKHYLVAQWFENGGQMCKYDDGTVLNMGAKICPLSIG